MTRCKEEVGKVKVQQLPDNAIQMENKSEARTNQRWWRIKNDMEWHDIVSPIKELGSRATDSLPKETSWMFESHGWLLFGDEISSKKLLTHVCARIQVGVEIDNRNPLLGAFTPWTDVLSLISSRAQNVVILSLAVKRNRTTIMAWACFTSAKKGDQCF